MQIKSEVWQSSLGLLITSYTAYAYSFKEVGLYVNSYIKLGYNAKN